MSYHDYWDGDCEMVKYYRQAEEYKQEQRNRQAWMQGLYFYRALLDVSPVLNPMSRKKTPRNYLKAPIPVTTAAEQREQANENRRKMADGKNAMQIMMRGINAKMKKGGAKNGS